MLITYSVVMLGMGLWGTIEGMVKNNDSLTIRGNTWLVGSMIVQSLTF